MMPEVFQDRRRNSWLECRKYKSKGKVKSDQVLTSAGSDGWTWWRTSVSVSMEEEEEVGTVRETEERAVVDMCLLKNSLLAEKT